jgi:hypothetical protein
MSLTKCEKVANPLLSRDYFLARRIVVVITFSHQSWAFFTVGAAPARNAHSTRITRAVSLMRMIEYISRKGLNASHTFARRMRGYTLKEKAKITAGAVTALVIVAWLAIIALALLSGGIINAAGDIPGTLFYFGYIRNFVLPRRTTDQVRHS